MSAKDLWTSKINGQQKMSMCQLQGPIDIKYINIYTKRHPVGSFDKVYLSCFHIRISWVLMEQPWFQFFGPPQACAEPQKPQTLTASKRKYEKFGPKI